MGDALAHLHPRHGDLHQLAPGRVHLTVEGIAGADIQTSKQVFARAAIDREPLVLVIRAGLERCGEYDAPAEQFCIERGEDTPVGRSQGDAA
jgi:hypothetical protein